MTNNIEKLYEILVDTLELILLPKRNDSSYLMEIEEKLSEIKGDAYTFLHKNSLQILLDNKLIDSHLFELISEIWSQIESIKPYLWNPTDFINSSEWGAIRDKVKVILAYINRNK